MTICRPAKNPTTRQRTHRPRSGIGIRWLYPLRADVWQWHRVYLIDMQGQTVHTWKLLHLPGLYGYLHDNSHLFYSGKPQEDVERLPPWQRGFKTGATMEVDWHGRVLWEVRHPDHHHDARKLRMATLSCFAWRRCHASSSRASKGGCRGQNMTELCHPDHLQHHLNHSDSYPRLPESFSAFTINCYPRGELLKPAATVSPKNGLVGQCSSSRSATCLGATAKGSATM